MSAPYCLITSCGRGGVAERLRHLHAVLVEGEAVGHAPRRRARGRGCRRPAASRSGTSRGAGRCLRGRRSAGQMPSGRSRSAKAWVEPESNQTSRMSVTFSQSSCGWSLARKRALAFVLEPGVGALVLEGLLDAGVDGRVAEDLGGAVGVALDEAGERHAPGALAREHPVGAGLDHREEAVAAGSAGTTGRGGRSR